MKHLLYPAALLMVATTCLGDLPFVDSFESGLGAWTTNGAWGLTTQQAKSPTHSMADSPGAFYANNIDHSVVLSSPLDLSSSIRPALNFYIRYVLESGYDFLYAEMSVNGGGTWNVLPGGTFTGTDSAWQMVQLALDSAAGAPNVRIRFRISTDGSVVQDGVYIDDVVIGERPTPVSLLATSDAPTRVALNWSQAGESDVAAYQLVRSLSSNVDVRTATVVATIPDPATTNALDIAVSPKTRYFYRVLTVRSNGLYEASNEVSVQTPDGMEAPFLDNGEGGAATWVADPPWALDSDAAVSGSFGWSDSPGTNYADGVNASLTLAAPVNITGWSRPTLMFLHRHQFLPGDSGYVEVSTNAGSSWSALATFTASSSSWTRARFDLSAFSGGPSFLVRLRVTSDASGNADGWRLDDISLSDAPEMVPSPNISELQPTSVRLGWPASSHPALSHYMVVCSTSNNPTLNSSTSAMVFTNTLIDTGLMVDSNYYYRVFAVDAWGGYSPASPTASVARTIIPPLPVQDDFESGADLWLLQDGWVLSTGAAHSGSSFIENGSVNYSNNLNSTAILRVNLTGAARPVLRFHDQHRLAVNDYGYLEVSAPGRTAYRMYGVYGSRTNWADQVVDLSYYKGYANVQILFRLTSDGSGSDEGWKIDDVSITDEGSTTYPVPFVEDFANGLGNWVETSRWAVADGALVDTLVRITPETHSFLSMDGDFNLMTTTNPQVSGWVKGSLGNYSYFGLQASADGGANWTTIWAHSTESAGLSNEWQRLQVSLVSYKASNTRLRWIFNSYYGTLADANVFVDKLTVAEASPGVGMLPLVPSLKSAQVSWTPSGIGPAFQTYRVIRSIDGAVNANDVLIGVITSANETAMTDTGLTIGATYWYWVYVTDTNDNWTISTNIVSTTTVPVTLPFTDAMNDESQWDFTDGWGVNTNEGNLTDSPGGDYGINLNSTAKTAINLAGSVRPVLRFRDTHRLAVNDYGYLEVSAPGRTAYRMYGVYGSRTNWEDQVIDLSYFKGYANVQILFRLTTDGTGFDEGWKIDDVSITDEGSTTYSVPFVEDFANGLGNWVETSRWAVADGALVDTLVRITPETHSYLSMDGDFNLMTTTNPQVSGWVKGSLGNYSYFGLQASADGGANWTTIWAHSTESASISNEWQRMQVSLVPYKASNTRLRWIFHSYYSTLADANVFVDTLTVAEAPPGVGMLPLVPSLKSAQVSWTPSGIGPAFETYRVIRSVDGAVNANDVLIGVITSANETAMTDTGLTIGATYWYWVYVTDTNDNWTISTNIVSTMTVPVTLPFADAMNNEGQWDFTDGWGVNTNEGNLTDSPSGDYGINLNSTAKTAINLTGSVRPVLRFRDTHRLAVNDYGYLEVSAPGRTAYRMYGVYGSRTNWEDQVIDLSYFKGYANVQILFRLTTDGTGFDEGWKIDDVSITDEGSTTYSVPFVEDFTNGLGQWVETSRWTTASGTLVDTLVRITPETHSYLSMDGDFNLMTTTNPQVSGWVKGSLGNYSYFGLQASADGGANWTTIWAHSTESASISNEWQRMQVSLVPYKASNTRLRWIFHSYYSTLADANVFVDKLTVAEAPPGVGMLPLVPSLKSAQVSWTPSGIGPAFETYRVIRSVDGAVNANDVVVGVITSANETAMTDTGLTIGATYWYWVYVTDTNDNWTISTNIVSTTTIPVVIPFTDGLSDLSQWDVTGTWGIDTNELILADSPNGNYLNSQDSYAQTAVNLIGTTWPVLRFKDMYRYAVNDYGYVEVSPNGSAYTKVYGISGGNTNWGSQEIDLSQWKNQSNLRIRFHMTSDGVGTDDGWLVDDVSVTDRGVHTMPVPFYEGFEPGRSNWLENTWILDTNQPYAGSNYIASSITHMRPEVQTRLPVAGSMDLSLTTNPRVTFRVRGSLGPYAGLQFQVSPDGGLTWANLWSVSYESGWSTNQWSQQLFSLAAYRTTDVRFRFLLYSYYGTYAPVNVAIDHFSVGETAPGAPFLQSPANFANTESIRPNLIVNNAFDPDFDPLTYRFEVYGDSDLTNLLSQVLAVASGVDQTLWQVDVNLENSRQYWWRCRAHDGSNTGPWMATATFFINETNAPPSTVVIAGPPKGATLRNPGGIISWYPASDADAGDDIRAYHIQIDPDPAFSAPLVDDQNVLVAEAPTGSYWTVSRSLSEISGWQNLGMISNYYWRIRAQDTRFKWSAWSVPGQWFIYGVPPPDSYDIRMNANGTITFVWDVGTEKFYVYHSLSLATQSWQVIAGPLDQNQITISPPADKREGFYRVSGE